MAIEMARGKVVAVRERSNPMATIAPARPKRSSSLRRRPLHRITVDEYERIIALGALEDPSRVELIDGYMVDKMGKNPGHSYATKQTLKALNNRLPAGWTWRQEQPVRIPAYDEPEPDIAIIRGTDADYRRRIPTAADVALLVEVSESTLVQDRGKKRSASSCSGPDPCLLDRESGRPPGRGLHPAGQGGPLSVAQGLQAGPAGADRDRRPAASPDRRRRHPALMADPRTSSGCPSRQRRPWPAHWLPSGVPLTPFLSGSP